MPCRCIGIAREVAALTRQHADAAAPSTPRRSAARSDATTRSRVHLDAAGGVPDVRRPRHRGVDNRAATPLWMRERLRRAGVRSISPVVDVTNYVMLELGQPMHAFDLAKLRGEIRVRLARAGETITLLDGKDGRGCTPTFC